MRSPPPAPNPRRVAAGKLNRTKRSPLTAAGVERLRQAALANKPWAKSTGPRSPAGKARSAANGLKRSVGAESLRAARRDAASLCDLFGAMAAARQALAADAIRREREGY